MVASPDDIQARRRYCRYYLGKCPDEEVQTAYFIQRSEVENARHSLGKNPAVLRAVHGGEHIDADAHRNSRQFVYGYTFGGYILAHLLTLYEDVIGRRQQPPIQQPSECPAPQGIKE